MLESRLSVVSSNVTFALTYDAPAFELMELGNRLIPDLYSCFREFGVTLADVRTQGEPVSLASQAVSVFFGTNAVLRFSFERTEFTAVQPAEEDLHRYSSIVDRSVQWIRDRAPSVSVKEHELTYNAHTETFGGISSREILASLVRLDVEGPGEQTGHGLILHWSDKQSGAQVSLNLDHSIVVPSGLFLGYSRKGSGCPQDMLLFTQEAREELLKLMTNLHLRFSDE